MNLKYSDFLQARDMAASVAAYPPLEQVTTVKGETIKFQAVLEIPNYLETEPWEVSLWYSRCDSSTNTDWTEAVFVLSKMDESPASLHWPTDHDQSRLYFSLTLPWDNASSLNFTIKFRQSPDHSWRWARDEQGLADGLVILAKPAQGNSSHADVQLPDIIHGLNPNLKWRSRMSQCPGTELWSIEVPVGGVKEDKSTFADVPLGVPWGQFVR